MDAFRLHYVIYVTPQPRKGAIGAGHTTLAILQHEDYIKVISCDFATPRKQRENLKKRPCLGTFRVNDPGRRVTVASS